MGEQKKKLHGWHFTSWYLITSWTDYTCVYFTRTHGRPTSWSKHGISSLRTDVFLPKRCFRPLWVFNCCTGSIGSLTHMRFAGRKPKQGQEVNGNISTSFELIKGEGSKYVIGQRCQTCDLWPAKGFIQTHRMNYNPWSKSKLSALGGKAPVCVIPVEGQIEQ